MDLCVNLVWGEGMGKNGFHIWPRTDDQEAVKGKA